MLDNGTDGFVDQKMVPAAVRLSRHLRSSASVRGAVRAVASGLLVSSWHRRKTRREADARYAVPWYFRFLLPYLMLYGIPLYMTLRSMYTRKDRALW